MSSDSDIDMDMNEKSNLQDAQNVMLEIFDEFDRICRKFDIIYWIDFGSLLGAVRHKGFIPWDDDLDVSMLKKDYKKFLEIAKEELDGRFFLQTKGSDRAYLNFFAKIRDNNSLFIDKWEVKREIKYHQGIYIDIFPAMRVGRKSLKSPIFRSLIILSKLTHNRFWRVDVLTEYFINLINRYEDMDGEFLISAGETMHFLKPVRFTDIFPLEYGIFEGRRVPIPKDSNIYLKTIFGDDYMSLPPEDKRVFHSEKIEIGVDNLWKRYSSSRR